MSDEQVNGDLKETIDDRYGVTPRYILQVLGTDLGRKIYADTWVDFWGREYAKSYDPSEVTIVTDVRFRNEVRAIKDRGGVVWKIVRVDGPGAKGGVKGHASEDEQKAIPDEEFNAIIKARSGEVDNLILCALEEYMALTYKLTGVF